MHISHLPLRADLHDHAWQARGTTYATDFSQNLYTVNPITAAATLIGPTGIPAVPATPLSTNPDGTTNLYTATLFGAGGNLYSTFDAFTIDFSTFAITPVVPANLYRINPMTGLGTMIAPTSFNLSAAVNVNGTTYAFNALTNQVLTLNLTNGNTSFVSNLDPAAERIYGASPVPEPASIGLAGFGIAAALLWRRATTLSAPRDSLMPKRLYYHAALTAVTSSAFRGISLETRLSRPPLGNGSGGC
ncbi:MAG: PEP-CTERM sorting domain-containing protein [Bryobacteraceae bacterium]